MPDAAPPPRQDGAGNGAAPGSHGAPTGGAAGADAFASLRDLLVGPEHRAVAALEARLDDPDRRAREIGAVLPRVLARHAHDADLAKALTPSVERAITASVGRNPRPLADALFPVMGPAIRRAVAAGLTGMVESLNRTLALALSRRSFRWRVEAWRTGRPFAEVVLSKTLLYRVEQVFLIDRNTGLLLQHVAADVDGVRDADMVSGMLTAIRAFVTDSFQVGEHDSLGSLEVGDLRVWIEAGPHAVIAAVIRGAAPHEYRATLVEAVEGVHLQYAEAFAGFDGDASVFDGSRPILESCLHTQFLTDARPPARRGSRVVFALLALAVLVWVAFAVRDRIRWQRYLEALRAEPGITVVAAERSWGRFVVTGLRDPLAADPVPLVAAAGLAPDDVRGHWTPYQALDSSMVLARAVAALAPPPGVTLALADGVLSSAGAAPAAWLAEARRMAPYLAGIQRFDATAAVEPALAAAADAVAGVVVLFPAGRTSPVEPQVVARLAARVAELGALADAAGVRFRVDIVGHTDEDGPPETNLALSRARAEAVRAALGATPAALLLETSGVGSTQPVVEGRTEADKRRNRRVALTATRID